MTLRCSVCSNECIAHQAAHIACADCFAELVVCWLCATQEASSYEQLTTMKKEHQCAPSQLPN